MTPLRFHRSFQVALLAVALVLPSVVHAQSELTKPYNLHIVVHVARNRLLTDVFRDRIERELHDGFQAALGDMGRVTVTHEHPRLPDVLARGLKQSLDDWKDRTDVKTHFVLIDFSGVHYEIQTRQYDGAIGRASPVVRHDRTRDRDFVVKAAALLLKQDFGILGTILEGPSGAKKSVKIQLRGGGLGDMARWVKKDDVFALAPPGGGSPLALRWSLLQVEQAPAEDARDGLCVCRFFHRYNVPNIAGYRCIKLGTVQTPLRLRWIQEKPGGLKVKPLALRLTVDIRRYGFDGEDATRLQKSTDQNGVLETIRDGKDGVFANVAFVRVIDGMEDPKPQIPLALVDDQPIFIEVNAAKDVDVLFTVRVANWQNNVADSLQMQANLFKRLESLSTKADQREEIVREAERGVQRSRDDRVLLLKQKDELVKEARAKKRTLTTLREDKRLADLAEGERVLEQFIGEQRKIGAIENDPQLKKWRSEIENAKLLETGLELGQAIDIYERIQKEGYKDAGLDAHLKKLHDLWKVADAEHEQARRFIYRVWPTLDSEHLEDNIPKARQALQKCEAAGDLVTIRKLVKETATHADRLKKELSELNPDIISDDVEPARQRKKVSEQIVRLGSESQEYLETHKPAK
jgi:hypothetical protein